MSRSGFVNDAGERGRLYFTVGLPHSGKSTFANEWAKQAGMDVVKRDDIYYIQRPRVVIAGDDFRWALTGHEYLPHAESHVFSVMDTAALAHLRRGYDVLIDETSTSKPTLMRYLRLDPNAKPLFMEATPEICKERARKNGRDYLVRVIARLAPRLVSLQNDWATIRADLLSQIEHRMSEDIAVVE